MIWNPFRAAASPSPPPPPSAPPPDREPPLVCEPDISGGSQPFWNLLGRTIAVCELRVEPANPRDCLRSPDHRPRTLESSYAAAVRTMAYGPRRISPKTEPDLTRGRLLVYYPDAELSDGAAEAESGGFFDVCNAPPWDTWVAMVTDAAAPEYQREQLISWVPDAFIAHVQRGIDVNPEECIVWLDESGTRFARLVARDRARPG